MALRLYNTLTRSLEPFTPLSPPTVTMYVCGPTVYDDPHIGHARSAYTFDVLCRYLKHKNYKVTFVRNVTDVDDKIIQKAREELQGGDLKEKCREVAERYLDSYHAVLKQLGIDPPTHEPSATEYVVPNPKNVEATKKIDASMTGFISQLITKNMAYVAGGNVYFSVRKFPDYGKLSNRSLDELKTGTRIEPGEGKEDPLDFALWKAAKPEEPSWNSPWGPGRPGWHIECSVMSTAYLGDAFDIHGGGLDLIFPHHENEIAQAQALNKPFAKYWIHNGLLTVNGEKMSKSLGNFITVDQALNDCDQNPDILKMFFLGAHYRSPLNYTKVHTAASKQHYENYRRLIDLANNTTFTANAKAPTISDKEVEEPTRRFFDALDDDLNTPRALSALDEIRNVGSRRLDEVHQAIDQERSERTGRFLSVVSVLKEHGKLLGLEWLEKTDLSKQVDELFVNALFEQYQAARSRKDFNASDTLRKKLNELGRIIQDTGGKSIMLPKR